MMNYKTLVAATLTSIVYTSSAFAQCPACALYPNRDPLPGVETPAGKMGLELPYGAASVMVRYALLRLVQVYEKLREDFAAFIRAERQNEIEATLGV